METTVTLSSKGQLALPKGLRQEDHLRQSDVFRLVRLRPGTYLLERLAPPRLPRAALVRSKDGFLVFRPHRGAPEMTTELVKKLGAETIITWWHWLGNIGATLPRSMRLWRGPSPGIQTG